MSALKRIQEAALSQIAGSGVTISHGAKQFALAIALTAVAGMANAASTDYPMGGTYSPPSQPTYKIKNDTSIPDEIYSVNENTSIAVTRPVDTTGSRIVRGSIGGVVGGLVGSLFGKGNGKTLMTVVGAVGGAIAADRIFAPKAKVRAVNSDHSSGYDANQYEFSNGNKPLTDEEYQNLEEWVSSAEELKNTQINNRQEILNLKYQLDFASPSTHRDIKRDLSKHISAEKNIAKSFKDVTGHANSKIWVAAMDYDRKVPDELILRMGSLLQFNANTSIDSNLKNVNYKHTQSKSKYNF